MAGDLFGTESEPRVTSERLVALASLLRGYRFVITSEAELQAALARLLSDAGERFQREVVIGPRDRIDFLLDDGVGLEVKVDGSLAAVTRQVHRYAQSAVVAGVLLVTTRHRHDHLPLSFSGKPVRVHRIEGAGL